jgi:endo-1,4-beta-xylanase
MSSINSAKITHYSSLKEVFESDFLIGAALNLDQITGRDLKAIAIIKKHFNSISPENILKWEAVHPEPNRYDFTAADQYVTFGEKHKMRIIGHTLVWFHQTPDWVFANEAGKPLSRGALLDRMRDHIFTVVGRYKGRIHGWDVVNEAVMQDGTFRKCKWFEIIGEDYVQKAFEYAHEADPAAQLYYNEYDTEHQAKRDSVIRLIKNLQARGVRVDGIGTQGHWFLDYPTLAEIEKSIVELSVLNIPQMITELDIGILPFYPVDSKMVDLSAFDPETQKKYNPYVDGLPDSVQKDQAIRYGELFALFHKHRNKISRITFWAVHDKQSWRSYLPIRGRVDYPTLFDRQCRPKLALDAIIKKINPKQPDLQTRT